MIPFPEANEGSAALYETAFFDYNSLDWPAAFFRGFPAARKMAAPGFLV